MKLVNCSVSTVTRTLSILLIIIIIQIILFVIVFQRPPPDRCLLLLTARGFGSFEASRILDKRRVQQPWRASVFHANITTELDTLSIKFGPYWQWQWMRKRVEKMWPEWTTSARALLMKQNMSNRRKKRVLVIPGVLMWTNYAIPDVIKTGGPLGDLVQWSDLIAGLHVLGHDVTLTHDSYTASQVFEASQERSCREPFDLIYMDILAAKTKGVSRILDTARCKVRIIDAYGTEAMFNHAEYAVDHDMESPWGGLGLDLKQFYTFYPHTPDNSFLGFAVSQVEPFMKKESNMSLLYGKSASFTKGVDVHQYLKLLAELTEVHATMSDPDNILPPEVHNHDVVDQETYRTLASQVKVLIGLYDPLESTGVMVALAGGCIFINPRFSGKILRGKPTTRKLTSQVPYLENFIGPPHVFTVDIEDDEQVRRAIRTALHLKSKPFVPYEFTVEGFLQRLNAYIENQQFCDAKNHRYSRWPPERCQKILIAPIGVSCLEACHQKGLICEPTYFSSLDSKEKFRKVKVSCNSIKTQADIFYPAFKPSDGACIFQKDPLLFSCVGSHRDLQRLCPCRTFIKHQIALC